MSNKKLYQVGLIAAILSTAGWLLYILAATGPDLSLIDDPQQYFQALQDARSTRLLYGWGGVLGTLLTIPYILAFHYATEDAGSVRIVATTTAVIGSVLTAVGFMSTALSSAYFLLPMALESAPEALAMMKIAATFSTRVFEVMWWVGSFLAYGLGVGLMSIHAWHSTSAPKWINGVGIVGGLSGIIWLRHFIPFLLPLTTPLSLVNILTVSIWTIGLSVALARQES